MKHFEVKNLSKDLDILLQYIVDNKITNAYLNYGLIRNTKILAKAVSIIDEAIPARLKELESAMYEEGLKKFEKLEKKDTTLTALPQETKQSRIFNIGYTEATVEDRKERDDLITDYNNFLSTENDIVLYTIGFEGVKDINIELKYWNILDNFIKQP